MSASPSPSPVFELPTNEVVAVEQLDEVTVAKPEIVDITVVD